MDNKGETGVVNQVVAGIIIIFVLVMLVFAVIFTLSIVTPTANQVTSISGSDLNFLVDNNTISQLSTTPSGNFAINANQFTALGFDGINSFINVSKALNPSALNFTGGKNFTITFFMNTSNVNKANQTIFAKSRRVGKQGWEVNMQSGILFLNVGNGTAGLGPTGWSENNFSKFTAFNNTYYHIAIAFNETPLGQRATADLYVNGVYNSTVVLPATVYNITDANFAPIIGNNYSNGTLTGFNGTLDEIRIYNTTLTAAQISDLSNTGRNHEVNALGSATDAALVFYLSLNENSGTTAYDTSRWKNNGTIFTGTYQNDGVSVSLVSGPFADYNQTGDKWELNNDSFAWAELDATYSASSVENNFNNTALNFTSGLENLTSQIPSIFRMLGVILVIGFLGLMVALLYKAFRGEGSGGGGL